MDRSEDRPQLSPLVTALNELSWSDIKRIAFHLDESVDLPLLTNIEREYPIEERVLYTMKAWLERDCEASWAKVVSALKVVKQQVLAMKIEAEHCTAQNPTKPIPLSSPGPIVSSLTTEPQLNTPSRPENEARARSLPSLTATNTASVVAEPPMPAFDPSAAHHCHRRPPIAGPPMPAFDPTAAQHCHRRPPIAGPPMPAFDPSAAHHWHRRPPIAGPPMPVVNSIASDPHLYNNEYRSIGARSQETPGEAAQEIHEESRGDREQGHQSQQLISLSLVAVMVILLVAAVAITAGVHRGIALLLNTETARIPVALVVLTAGGAIAAATKGLTTKTKPAVCDSVAEVTLLVLFALAATGIAESTQLTAAAVIAAAVAEAAIPRRRRIGSAAVARAGTVVIATVAAAIEKYTAAPAAGVGIELVGIAAVIGAVTAIGVTGTLGAAVAIVAAVAAAVAHAKWLAAFGGEIGKRFEIFWAIAAASGAAVAVIKIASERQERAAAAKAGAVAYIITSIIITVAATTIVDYKQYKPEVVAEKEAILIAVTLIAVAAAGGGRTATVVVATGAGAGQIATAAAAVGVEIVGTITVTAVGAKSVFTVGIFILLIALIPLEEAGEQTKEIAEAVILALCALTGGVCIAIIEAYLQGADIIIMTAATGLVMEVVKEEVPHDITCLFIPLKAVMIVTTASIVIGPLPVAIAAAIILSWKLLNKNRRK